MLLVSDTNHQYTSVIRSLVLNTIDYPGAFLGDGQPRTQRSTQFHLWSQEPLLLETPSRESNSGNNFEVSGIDSTIVNFFADQIFEKFPWVALIAYWREGRKLTVWTVMSELDRIQRRRIYRSQEELVLRFPEYLFDCYVVSAVNAIPDSFTKIRPDR